MNKLEMKTKLISNLDQSAGGGGNLNLSGIYQYELIDKNNQIKDFWKSKNNLTNQGLQYIINSSLRNIAPSANWYVGIYTAYSGTIVNLTNSDIGGALTEFTNYTGNRHAYTAYLSNQTLSNVLTKADFPILASGTIQGGFLVNAATGNGTVLFSVDDFTGGSRTVNNGDTLKVTYELTASN